MIYVTLIANGFELDLSRIKRGHSIRCDDQDSFDYYYHYYYHYYYQYFYNTTNLVLSGCYYSLSPVRFMHRSLLIHQGLNSGDTWNDFGELSS